VREWELSGDKIALRDLGIRNYPVLQVQVEKDLRKDRRIGITYDHFFISGRSVFNRDIIYNGTIINGRNGIDVSPTRYYRLSAIFTSPLLHLSNLDLRYKASLVVDYITFYLDGQVSPSSKSTEVFERFGRQAFPYPVVGIDGSVALDRKSRIDFEVSGSYVPKFKSFYTEGGNMHLHYRNFSTGLSYSRAISDLFVVTGVRMRYLYLFQESREDTNIITLLTWAPYIGVSYHFPKRAVQ
jgi:hypothetical protein